MEKFLSDFNLKSILVSNDPTFHHNNHTSSSQIDHIFYYIPESNAINVKFLEHLCKLRNSANLSSHDVIIGDLSLPFFPEEKSETNYSETYQPFLVNKPIWDESGIQHYQDQTYNILSGLLETFQGPEFTPALSEMFSKTLVLSAENSFETVKPNLEKKKQKIPKFSKEHIQAYKDHELICRKWRKAGRPKSNLHPIKTLKLDSQRKLQKIARDEASKKAIKTHEELMESHAKDINKVYSKLKRLRGAQAKSVEITSIETLCGIYEGENVLEGFCANTEKLCSQKSMASELDNNFYQICKDDNMIILELSTEDEIKIPYMKLSDLKCIIFKRLKLNKACDVFQLTVEHLRNAGDDNLALILRLLNQIIDNLNYLSAPQLNKAVATMVHKGKGKPVYHHKSYRQVRVTPLVVFLINICAQSRLE